MSQQIFAIVAQLAVIATPIAIAILSWLMWTARRDSSTEARVTSLEQVVTALSAKIEALTAKTVTREEYERQADRFAESIKRVHERLDHVVTKDDFDRLLRLLTKEGKNA